MAASVANINLPTNEQAAYVISETLANGGGSFFPMWMESLIVGETNSGYVVSTNPERGIVVPLSDFTQSLVMTFVANNYDYIDNWNYGGKRTGRYVSQVVKLFGTWVNDGQVHLDVVTLVAKLDTAMALGREHNQRAIFDADNMVDINL